MKNDKDYSDKDRLDVIPKELQRLSKGILQELEEEHPTAIENTSLEIINDLIRQELSKVFGLEQLAENKDPGVKKNSYRDVHMKLRAFLLSQSQERRLELFRPLANEFGYYSWNQWIKKLNIISQASKGSIK
jgi:uncharacterized protein (DUF2164 family)